MGAGFSYVDAAQVEHIYALNTQQIVYLRKIRLAAEGGGPESDALRQAIAEALAWNSEEGQGVRLAVALFSYLRE